MIINGFNANEKILKYIDKINNYFNRNNTLIVTELDLTNNCNNKCPACVGKNHVKAELTWNEIKAISKGLYNLNSKGVILSGGGDPLLHPDFTEAVKLLKSYKMRIGINSNGLLLDEKKATVIAENCDYFRISLDAGDETLYKQTHGIDGDAFKKVINNIKMISEIKRKLKSNLSLGTGFLTSEVTKGQMEKFIKISKENGADFAQFRPFQEDMTDITEIYNRLKSIYEDDKFKVIASTQKYSKFKDGNKKTYDKCTGMLFSTVITANARMYACLHHRQNDDYLIGDIRQGKSLEEIWNSYKKWHLHDTIDVRNCPSFCRNDSVSQVLFDLEKKVGHSEFL